MKLAINSLLLLSSTLLATPVLAAATKVEATIDLSAPAQAATQIDDFASKLTAADGLIHLNLTIVPSGTEALRDYQVSWTSAKSGSVLPLRCDNSWARMTGATSGFSLALSNHLVLTIKNTDSAAAPFNTAACEYKGSEVPVFSIRGYYAKSEIGIPTANDIELRPVTPAMAP